MRVPKQCDDPQPHQRHGYALPPHPDLPRQNFWGDCDGVPWPSLPQEQRCESLVLSEGHGHYDRDVFYQCARPRGHVVDFTRKEYHCTASFAVMWSRNDREITNFYITISVEAESYQEAKALADMIEANDPDLTVTEVVPGVLGYKVVL